MFLCWAKSTKDISRQRRRRKPRFSSSCPLNESLTKKSTTPLWSKYHSSPCVGEATRRCGLCRKLKTIKIQAAHATELCSRLNRDSWASGQIPSRRGCEPSSRKPSDCRSRPYSSGENSRRLPLWRNVGLQLRPSRHLRPFVPLHPAPDKFPPPLRGGAENLSRQAQSPSGKNQPLHRSH